MEIMEVSKNITFGILTVNDDCFSKGCDDTTGNELRRVLIKGEIVPTCSVVWTGIVPDDISLIKGSVNHCCDVIKVNILLISEGVGLDLKDRTENALRECIDKEVPGMSFLILQEGLPKTSPSSLSRVFVGVRKQTLIANLPGSLKCSGENLKTIITAALIPLAVDLIDDLKNAVDIVHKEEVALSVVVKSKVKHYGRSGVYDPYNTLFKRNNLPDLFQNFVLPLGIHKIRLEDALGFAIAENIRSCENSAHVLTKDINIGQVLVQRNALIDGKKLAILSAIGCRDVQVFRKPVIAVLLVNYNTSQTQETDISKVFYQWLLRSCTFPFIDLGAVPEEPDVVLKALRDGFNSADVVITIRGMIHYSNNCKNIIERVLIEDLGAKIHFNMLDIPPSYQIGFGILNYKKQPKYWLGMSSSTPTVNFATAYLVVLPFLKTLSGWTSNIFPRRILATAAQDITYDSFLPGILSNVGPDNALLKIPSVDTVSLGELKQPFSYNIVHWSRSNCLIRSISGGSIKKGTEVNVTLLE